MAVKRKKALPSTDIPYFGCVVEGACQQFVAVCVKMQTYNFRAMPAKIENLLTGLYIPQLSCVVHRTCGYKHAMRVEGKADDLHFVAFQRVVALTRVCIPDFCFLVKRTRHDFVSNQVSHKTLTRKDY